VKTLQESAVDSSWSLMQQNHIGVVNINCAYDHQTETNRVCSCMWPTSNL